MASTVFSDIDQTPLVASWFNDVNNAVYNSVFPGGLFITVANGGTGASTAAGARTNLGLAIGTNVEAWNAGLDSLAALASGHISELVALSGSSSTGLMVRTGTAAYSQVSIVAGTGITVTNGSGVSGNITISTSGSTPTSLTLNGATSGSTTITGAAIAGSTALQLKVAGNGTSSMTFPATTDTVVCAGQPNQFTATQVFQTGDFALLGSSTGKTTVNTANSGASNFTLTLPAVTDTVATIGSPQTFTATNKFSQNTLALLGSSTGTTTLNSGLSSTGSNTLTLPTTSSDTLAALGTVQTWTAAQTFTSSDFILAGASSGTSILNAAATAGMTTLTLQGTTGTIYSTGGTAVAVTDGGTGQGSGYTAYSPILAGTTSTGAFQDSGTIGSSGTVFTSNGPGAAPTWQSGSGGVSLAGNNTWTGVQQFGTIGGAVGKLKLAGSTSGSTIVNAAAIAGSGTMTLPTGTDTLAALGTVQTWTAAQTFTDGDFLLKGSSSGTTTLKSNSAAGSSVITFPAATDTVAVLGTAQSWSAAQTFPNNDLILKGSSTGVTTLNSGLSGAGSNTLILPTTSSDTLAAVGTTQTWTAAQTFTNSDIKLLGSSTGATTLTSANSGASNFTLTLPAVSDTVATIGTAQTWTAAQTFTSSDFILKGSSTGVTTLNSGLSGVGNNTLTLPITSTDTLAGIGTAQTWTAAQTFTNSDIKLLGSSTGATTLTSANSGASNFTLTLPAVTDTIATVGTAQTWTAVQSFNDGDLLLKGATSGTTVLKSNATAGTSVITFPAVTGIAYVSGDGATNPVAVTDGGTGVATLTTAYGVLCAGTTATGTVQTISSLGSSGQVLTSQGAGSLPHWAPSSGGGGTNVGTAYLVTTHQIF